MKLDFNALYRFISDGTWFLAGSECEIEDGDCIWLGHQKPDETWTHEFLIANQNKIAGLFRGPIDGNPDDGELCGLDEFEIIPR